MRNRHRSRAADPAVEARVGAVLARPTTGGGWVPPELADDPLPETSWSSRPEPRLDVDPLPETPWSRGPEPRLDADPPPETPWSSRLEPEPDAPARSWSPGPGDADEPPPPRAGLLPATLAGGRLDPGHRGAVALLLVCLLAAILAAGVVLRGRPQEVQVPAVEQVGTALPGVAAPPPPAVPAEPAELVVAVVGEVVSPGVVTLPPGSRVGDALRAAGGLAPGGSAGLLNLARKLADGEQLLVGPDAPPDSAAAPAGGGGSAGGLVDLNAATAEQLEALPGIGPVLAERIVSWRTENGPFASVDQLREVSGIGEATYADLESEVTV